MKAVGDFELMIVGAEVGAQSLHAQPVELEPARQQTTTGGGIFSWSGDFLHHNIPDQLRCQSFLDQWQTKKHSPILSQKTSQRYTSWFKEQTPQRLALIVGPPSGKNNPEAE